MRIVNKQEFYTLPSGTLYSEYRPCHFNGLMIKLDTCYHSENNDPFDFLYIDLIGSVKAESSDEEADILHAREKDGKSFAMEFDCSARDGLYEDDALYAIYEVEDIMGLGMAIVNCIRPTQEYKYKNL